MGSSVSKKKESSQCSISHKSSLDSSLLSIYNPFATSPLINPQYQHNKYQDIVFNKRQQEPLCLSLVGLQFLCQGFLRYQINIINTNALNHHCNYDNNFKSNHTTKSHYKNKHPRHINITKTNQNVSNLNHSCVFKNYPIDDVSSILIKMIGFRRQFDISIKLNKQTRSQSRSRKWTFSNFAIPILFKPIVNINQTIHKDVFKYTNLNNNNNNAYDININNEKTVINIQYLGKDSKSQSKGYDMQFGIIGIPKCNLEIKNNDININTNNFNHNMNDKHNKHSSKQEKKHSNYNPNYNIYNNLSLFEKFFIYEIGDPNYKTMLDNINVKFSSIDKIKNNPHLNFIQNMQFFCLHYVASCTATVLGATQQKYLCRFWQNKSNINYGFNRFGHHPTDSNSADYTVIGNEDVFLSDIAFEKFDSIDIVVEKKSLQLIDDLDEDLSEYYLSFLKNGCKYDMIGDKGKIALDCETYFYYLAMASEQSNFKITYKH